MGIGAWLVTESWELYSVTSGVADPEVTCLFA